MRSLIAALPLLALTACGGASGPQSVGSIAPPASGGGTGGTGGTGGSGGTGGGIGGGTGGTATPTPTPSNLLDVGSETSFNAVGSFHTLDVTESGVPSSSGPVLYQGNASTVRAPSGSVSYNPRDGIFTVQFTDTKAGMATGPVRFQDPAHRTDYGGSASPSWGTPNINGFNYLEAVGPTARAPGTSAGDYGRTDTITFFYQRPGTQTKHVTLAGYVRNAFEPTADPLVFKSPTVSNFQRGAMVFGTETVRSEVPLSGTGRYTGGMLATMVVNSSLDTDRAMPNYFQWITGSSEINLDFGASTMNMILTGTTHPATYAGVVLPANQTGVPGGSEFRAVGSGSINLTSTGGFTGKFSSVTFSNTLNGQTIPIYESVNPGNSNAGANSIDGTFFGPGAVNVGGNFRIVGGVPDQRVDILGAFTGAKQ